MLRAVHNLSLPMVPTVYSRMLRDILVVGEDADGTPSVCKRDLCLHACTPANRLRVERFREEV